MTGCAAPPPREMDNVGADVAASLWRQSRRLRGGRTWVEPVLRAAWFPADRAGNIATAFVGVAEASSWKSRRRWSGSNRRSVHAAGSTIPPEQEPYLTEARRLGAA